MKYLHFENYMYDPLIAEVCLNCKHKDCKEGICDDFRDAFRRVMGYPDRKTKNKNWTAPNGEGLWQHVEAFGECHSLSEWSAITGISYVTLRTRVAVYGWPIERALGSKPDQFPQRIEVEVDGKKMTLREWAEELGVGHSTIYKYIKKLGSKEAAIRRFMKEGTK